MLSFPLLYQGLLSFVATLGFAILYNAPRKSLVVCGLVGMGGHLLRTVLQNAGASTTVAIFLGSLFVGGVAALPARYLQLPMILFTITGIISMIPGIPAYKVVVYLNQGDIWGGLKSAVQAGFSIGAIATGIGTARILTDHDWWFDRE